MTAFRNSRAISKQMHSSLEEKRKLQREKALSTLGKNRKTILEVVKAYIKSRRYWIFAWRPVIMNQSFHYAHNSELLWGIEWETEDFTLQFVSDENGVWNTIIAYENWRGANMNELQKLKYSFEQLQYEVKFNFLDTSIV